jgi:putative glutamine amidotransferase
MGLPRIGMVADRREASFGAWRDVELTAVWSHYIDAIEAAGGAPVIFPAIERYVAAPDEILGGVDGLLLTGGRDIEARSYGAEPDPRNEPGNPLRDRLELALARAALGEEKPLFGVCRGMQVINVALGGGLVQHLEDPERLHIGRPGEFVDHVVSADPGTRLVEIIGSSPVTVRSHHHQGIEPIAGELTVSARSPDGLAEAVEAGAGGFCLAVLWHPEENLDQGGLALYEALVAAARERAGVAA